MYVKKLNKHTHTHTYTDTDTESDKQPARTSSSLELMSVSTMALLAPSGFLITFRIVPVSPVNLDQHKKHRHQCQRRPPAIRRNRIKG